MNVKLLEALGYHLVVTVPPFFYVGAKEAGVCQSNLPRSSWALQDVQEQMCERCSGACVIFFLDHLHLDLQCVSHSS